MAINYASEKFIGAIHSIVTSAETTSPQDRVCTAANATGTLGEGFPA